MRITHMILCVILVSLSLPAISSASDKIKSKNYYLAIKGGVSLGSYESGINNVLLNYIHEQEQYGSRLVSFSGASAGSINSLLSAVKHCYREDANNDLMRDAWNIGLKEWLGNADDEEAALFSRKAMKEKIDKIKQIIKKPLTKDCDLTITMSITRVRALRLQLRGSKQFIEFQRFVVPILVSGKAGDTVSFKNSTLLASQSQSRESQFKPGPYISLPEKDGKISFSNVVEVAYASSSFPIAFSPREIVHCLDFTLDPIGSNKHTNKSSCTRETAQKAFFSDGGLFDNSPVGVVRDLISAGKAGKEKVMYFINPDHIRTPNQ